MTEPKFTKGAWRYHGPYTHLNVTRWIVYFQDDHPSSGCEVFQANAGPRTCVANAHLIAAAPELYEALEELLRHFDEATRRNPYSYQAVKADARKALAKARGEVGDE